MDAAPADAATSAREADAGDASPLTVNALTADAPPARGEFTLVKDSDFASSADAVAAEIGAADDEDGATSAEPNAGAAADVAVQGVPDTTRARVSAVDPAPTSTPPRGSRPTTLADLPQPRYRHPMLWLVAAAMVGIAIARAWPLWPSAWETFALAGVGLAVLALATSRWISGWRVRVDALAMLLAAATVFGAAEARSGHFERAQQQRLPAGEYVPLLAIGRVIDPPCPLAATADPVNRKLDVRDAYNPMADAPAVVEDRVLFPDEIDSGRDDPDDADEYVPTNQFVRRAVFAFEVYAYIAGSPPNADAVTSDPATWGERGHVIAARETVLVYTDWKRPDLQVGEVVRLSGFALTPSAPGNPHQFDYARYLRERGIARLYMWERLHPAERLPGWGAQATPDPALWSGQVRQRIIKLAHDNLDEPRVGLFLTLTIGANAGLDPELRDLFQETGTVHLLVISGLHVGFLSLIVLVVLRLLRAPARLQAWIVIVFLLGYWLIVGEKIGITRAVAMGVVFSGGVLLGRRAAFATTLAAAALVALILNPHDLFNPGFQLSFIAVIGVHAAAPLGTSTRRRFGDEPTGVGLVLARNMRDFLWRCLLVSTIVFIATTALTWHHFSRITPGAVLINLVCVPCLMWTLTASLTVLLGAAIAQPVAALFGPGAEQAVVDVLAFACEMAGVGIDALVACVRIVRDNPISVLDAPTLHVVWIAPWLLCLIGIHMRRELRVPWRRVGIATALILGAGLATWSTALRTPRDATVTVLDCGHSCCTVIESADGRVAVIDPGSMGNGNIVKSVVRPFLLARGHTRIDVVFLSHSNRDHVDALDDLLDAFPVATVYVSPEFLNHHEEAITWLTPARAAGTPILVLRAGDRIGWEGVEIEVLGPAPDLAEQTGFDRNDTSLVLGVRLSAHDRDDTRYVLLPGDIEESGTDSLLRTLERRRGEIGPRPGEPLVLVLPHHGLSNDMLSAAIEQLTPAAAIAPTGRKGPAASSWSACEAARLPLWVSGQHGALGVGASGPLVRFLAPGAP